jgi:membrane-associated phospholipid phosphatase
LFKARNKYRNALLLRTSSTGFSSCKFVVETLLEILLTSAPSATAAVGGVFSKINGNRHAFALDDPAISFPYRSKDTVSVTVLIIVSVVAPGVIIAAICLLFVPGPTAPPSTPKSRIWRRKVWEWNTSWLGLGVALAGAFMVTEGLKDIYGKPRPDLLARCQPDLHAIAKYAVGGIGQIYEEAPVVVDWHICQQSDNSILRDGFASFPSGHSSFSFAGMTYLTLFLCAKYAITIPFLSPAPYSRRNYPAFETSETSMPTAAEDVSPRNQAAAPPVYLLILAFVPTGAALFIAGSRWSDYRHQGFDIVVGSLIGFIFAWFGFRLYHLPIRRGAGWSWGPRSRDRAFYLGLGTLSYVGEEGWDSAKVAEGRASQATREV